MTTSAGAPDPLARRLGVAGATVIGLGAMIGAGVFGAFAPAADAAGSALLVALLAAGCVAALNAASSARLAARHPVSGGAYVYGTRHLGPRWGLAAGWCFIAGKLASCCAMALVFGAYVTPGEPRAGALAAVVACATVNHIGLVSTLRVTAAILVVVLAGLVAAVIGGVSADGPGTAALDGWSDASPGAVLEAAGFLFFAFAGYARIATLGGEVRDPRRTIPRAILVAFVVALAVYATVAVAALGALGPEALAAASEPLAAVAGAGGGDGLVLMVRIAAAVACLGVLVSLLAGVSRTTFAMASDGWLPRPLAAVHPTARIPRAAGIAAAAVVLVAVALVDLRGAIGFSSVLVLGYYAVANASALTLPGGPWGVGRVAAAAGLVACLVVGVSLPPETLLVALAILVAGVAVIGSASRRGRERHGR